MRLNRSAVRPSGDPDAGLSALPAPRRPGTDDTGFGGGLHIAELEPIGQILVRQGALTQDQLVEPLLTQPTSGKRLGSLLVELGLIDERRLTAALAEQLLLEIVDLRQITPNPAIVPRLDEAVARELDAIPLYEDPDGSVVVAVSDPTDTVAPALRRALAGPVRLVLAPAGEIRRAIAGAYRVLVGVDEHIAAFTAVQGERPAAAALTGQVTADDAPVVQVVNKLITQALRDRASDIHIEPQDTGIRIRFRIDGALHDVLTLPSTMASAVTSRIKIMAGMNIVERRRPQDGQIAITLEGRALDIRVATAGMIWGEKVVMRLLDKSRPMFKLSDLGMPAKTHAVYGKLIRSPHGMVICAGPTGSGKTTTLYASLSEVNGSERNITTIEDPVEYIFPGINQIQINEQAGITFAEGLRAILRQDPDMILVGEIRDAETARIAVQSALTGHFVLSSLHATDAVSALYRFLDMGIESFLVSSSVLGIVGQRLVRRTCPDCKVPYSPTGEELEFLAQSGGGGKTEFWAGEGCNFCARTGYSDRVGVYEVLRVTEEMRELIVRPNPSHEEMRSLAIQQGMRPMRDEGIRLVLNDVTTIAEVLRSIYTL